MDILNAYLERNLRSNGGVLDGVIFAMVKYTMEDREKVVLLASRSFPVDFLYDLTSERRLFLGLFRCVFESFPMDHEWN